MGKARAIGIGVDNSRSSKSALKWAVDNLVDSEDRLILIHVLSPKSDHPKKQLFEDTGSRKNKFLFPSTAVIYCISTTTFFFLFLIFVNF